MKQDIVYFDKRGYHKAAVPNLNLQLRSFIAMKSVYQSPKLIRHGNVESITRAFGPSPAADSVFVGGSNVPIDIGSTGSVDGIIQRQ
jgi:hypothetical protein